MREQSADGRYACPCCGYATLNSVAGFEVCDICFWEDDGQDDADADVERGGPNSLSLTQARNNFRQFGANTPGEVDCVRKPTEHDVRLRKFD